ncbi:MAG TPA: ASPIC/UnbV domain-containing protein, partial [Blastocatellia bacterium]
LDVLVSNNGQEPQLLLNEGAARNHWLEVSLLGVRSNRDGVGARVKIVSGDLVSHDQRKGGRSYQSAHDSRLHFGLRARSKIDLVEIRWPSGAVDTLKNIEADRVITVKEGAGLITQSYPRWVRYRER